MRGRRARTGAAAVALVAAVAATATACGALLLEDKGPLPPRYSGPPLPPGTVLPELTSALESEGFTVERRSQDLVPTECTELLQARHEGPTADTALKAAFVRARSESGWRSEPGDGRDGVLSIRRGDWTAWTQLPEAATDAQGAAGPTSPGATIILKCDGSRSKTRAGTGSLTPSPTSS